MMRTLHFTVLGLALAATLPAQVKIQTTFATADAVGVYANRQIDGARAGTVIDPVLALNATDARKAHSASQAKKANLQTAAGLATSVHLAWQAGSTDGNLAGTLGGAPLTAGPQEYAVVYSSNTPVKGRLMITFHGTAYKAAATAVVEVAGVSKAFKADGTKQAVSVEGLTINGRLPVGIAIFGKAHSAAGEKSAYNANLGVWFLPETGAPVCKVEPYERSCPEGGVLKGSFGNTPSGGNSLKLDLAGALPKALGVTIVSPLGNTFQFTPSGCIFFKAPIVAFTFRTDENGDAQTTLGFPKHVGEFYLNQGTLVISPAGYQIATSNSLKVTCR
jgi:hypothetical protein